MDNNAPKNNKKLIKQEWLHICLLVAVVLAATGTFYFNQHHKQLNLSKENDSLKSSISSQTSTISSLNSNISDLTKQNTDLQNQVAKYKDLVSGSVNVPQASYLLTVNSAKHYAPRAYIFDDKVNTLLVIDITIKNNGSAAGFVSPGDFVLKDGSGSSQQTFADINYGNGNLYLPPSQPTVLTAQTIQAGDTTRASLAYFVASDTNSFSLKYNNNSYPVEVSGTISL